MTAYEKSLRFGSWVVICSLLLRLCFEGYPAKIKAFLIELETGRTVRSSLSEPVFAYAPESPPPAQAVPTETIEVTEAPIQPEPLEFTDADTVSLYNTSGLTVDPAALLQAEIRFPKSDGPQVLLYSTHATESYTKALEDYRESAAYRTLDPDFNVLSLGAALKAELEKQGIETVRDETLHDYPSYNAAYSHSRKAVKQYLKSTPSLALVLDLHRDAADTASGQLRTLANVEGASAAQIMLVVGTDARLSNPDWQENLSLALKLQALLERISPGITRPTCLRAQRFNQDLSPGCLLIEIGGAGNTHREALEAIPVLAQAITQLLQRLQ